MVAKHQHVASQAAIRYYYTLMNGWQCGVTGVTGVHVGIDLEWMGMQELASNPGIPTHGRTARWRPHCLPLIVGFLPGYCLHWEIVSNLCVCTHLPWSEEKWN